MNVLNDVSTIMNGLLWPLTMQRPNLRLTVVDVAAEDKLATRPCCQTAITAVFSVIDAVGIHAVMALNQAHGHLVKARVVTGPPPSDKWYRLLGQLERDLPSTERLSASSCDNNTANVGQQVCELLVGTAAFFASEASDLEDQIALLPDDPEHKTLRARLTSIANQAGYTADALLDHAEDGAWQELLDLHDSRNIAEAVLGNGERKTANTTSRHVASLAIAGSVQTQSKHEPRIPRPSAHSRRERRCPRCAPQRRQISRFRIAHIVLSSAAALLIAFSFSLGWVHLGDGGGMATPATPAIRDDRVAAVDQFTRDDDKARTFHILMIPGAIPILMIAGPQQSEIDPSRLFRCISLPNLHDQSPQVTDIIKTEDSRTYVGISTPAPRPSPQTTMSAQCAATAEDDAVAAEIREQLQERTMPSIHSTSPAAPR